MQARLRDRSRKQGKKAIKEIEGEIMGNEEKIGHIRGQIQAIDTKIEALEHKRETLSGKLEEMENLEIRSALGLAGIAVCEFGSLIDELAVLKKKREATQWE